jgi:peptidoglycan/xylan/chitin deacetylase (PgdA/CDA1 family)
MWRQKVRRVIHRGWVGDWEREPRLTRPVGRKSFYSYTKDPANDSSMVEAELDRFLAERGDTVETAGLWLGATDLAPRPGVAWGNHGHRHYVMSSLPRERQAEEIDHTEELLGGIAGLERSRVFSLPFGARHQMDEHTADLLAERGFTAVLLCRSRLTAARPERIGALTVLDRFMPDERPILDNLAGLELVAGA